MLLELGLLFDLDRAGAVISLAVEAALLVFAACCLVVRRAPLVGTLPTMVISAAEGATQIHSPCIAGIREKSNPAVNAVGQATLQLRMGLDNRVQRDLILPHKRLGAIVLVPIRAK